jgi:glyoxylase-like metal-dependent hydrolase (beta-lactamase superfamily II)
MIRIVASGLALMFGAMLAGPASAQSAQDLVKQAVAAQGGADALKALKTIAIKGDAKFWDPGQSHKPGGEARFLGDATYSATGDFTNHIVRIEWDRDQKYPAPEKIKYTETMSMQMGYVTNDKGASQPMSGIRLASHIREIMRGSPTLMLYALEHPDDVKSMPAQKLDGQSYPAIGLKVGQHNFTVLFDRKTKLPVAVRTKDHDNIAGDSTYEYVLSDWKAVGGVQMAHTKSGKLNGIEVVRYTEKEVGVNAPQLASTTAAAPDSVKDAKKPAADAPYQWVIRRIFLTRFLDSDDIIHAAGGGLKLVELAPNVQHVQGGAANNLIVAMKDHLVVFDAPYGEMQSKWVIDAAKAKYPGKPIKYLVLTHHHMDHTGGMRSYVAQGATIVVPEGSKELFAKAARAKATVAADAQQKAGNKAAKIVEVKDTMALKDDTMEIRLLNIPNPHVDGMIIAHLPASNIVFVTDLISPRGPIGRSPGSVAVGDALRKANITGATIAGGHGTTAKQAEIAQALAAN